jgi:hypothetical protein
MIPDGNDRNASTTKASVWIALHGLDTTTLGALLVILTKVAQARAAVEVVVAVGSLQRQSPCILEKRA